MTAKKWFNNKFTQYILGNILSFSEVNSPRSLGLVHSPNLDQDHQILQKYNFMGKMFSKTCIFSFLLKKRETQ